MIQSRLMSAVEALAMLVLGFDLAVGIRTAVFPVMGQRVTPVRSLKLPGAFTPATLLRTCVRRRVFERIARGVQVSSRRRNKPLSSGA